MCMVTHNLLYSTPTNYKNPNATGDYEVSDLGKTQDLF